jgi:hypothetical protein
MAILLRCSAYAAALIAARLLFGHLPDELGGASAIEELLRSYWDYQGFISRWRTLSTATATESRTGRPSSF